MSRKKILVTGGAGFIGTNLCMYLLERGHDVTVLDDFSTGTKRDLPGAKWIRQCVTEPFRIECDEIYHLACPASPEHYQEDPIQTLMTAVQGTYNALSCAEYAGARILIASTSEVYGQPLEHPQTEELWSHINPVGPRSCYDTGKAAAESLAANFCAQRGLQVRIARIHNTYGPHMDPDDGRMLPNFICQALQGESLTVYGDGSQTRSLCYVDDMVEGLVALLENESLANGMPVNIGNPEEYTVKQIADLVLAATPVLAEHVDMPRLAFEELPVDDPTRRCPDVSFMNRITGWKPKVSFAEGLRRTVEYFESIMEDDDDEEDTE